VAPSSRLVKRALLLLAAGAVAAVALLAGPALSLERWRPEPVDFELAVPDAALKPASVVAASRRVRFVSKPLRTPKRFNLVGARWRSGGEPLLSMRAREDGGSWTRWTRVGTHTEDGPDPGSGEPIVRGGSGPLWVGEADWVQYRLSRRVRGMRLHFVNVKGSATAADRLKTALRGGVNAALVSLAGSAAPEASAAEPQPDIVPREDWGAEDCPPRSAPELGEVKAAFIHHTVTANNYTPEESPEIVLGICRFHRNSNGWNDIGYQFLVDKYGTIFEGRAGGIDQPVIGAQAQGYNAQSTGISNLGTYTSVAQSQEALEAIARLIRWKLPLHGTSTMGNVVLTSAGGPSNRYPAGTQVRVKKISGHRDTNATECPGGALYAQLPELRELVGDVPASLDGTTTTLGVTPPRVDYGAEVFVSGRVRSGAGSALGGVPVLLQRRVPGRWVNVGEAITDGEGVYSSGLTPHANRTIRARYPGDGVLKPSNSVQRLVGVRPVVTLRRPPKRARLGRKVDIRGTVVPRKRTLQLVVQYRVRGRWGSPGVRRVRAKKGRFETFFYPGRSGSWRYYVVAKADDSTLRGASEKRLLSVRR
jgi:N-acetylmuramoyl-L-alanine amidase